MTLAPPPILCDVHELASGIPEMLALRYPVVTQEMPLADYGLVDVAQRCILVERKSASDLLSSISDGRLRSQLDRLQAPEVDAPFLLVEDEFRIHDGEVDTRTKATRGRSGHSLVTTYRHSKFDFPYIVTLLVRTLYLTRIRVLWSADREGSAHIIGALYRTSLRWPILLDGSQIYITEDE